MRLDPSKREVIGIICSLTLHGERGKESVLAKVDTGAARTSVDTDLAARVGLGPVTDSVKVRAASSAHSETRPLVQARVELGGRTFDLPVSITDRTDMKYPVIVGMDVLTEGGFLIDATVENHADGEGNTFK